MLAHICRVLNTTPNELLEFDALRAKSQREVGDLQRIMAAAQALSPENLRMAADIMDAMVAHRERTSRSQGKSAPLRFQCHTLPSQGKSRRTELSRSQVGQLGRFEARILLDQGGESTETAGYWERIGRLL
jgi:hypothetical protein